MDKAITLREKRMEILRELNSIEEQITGSSKSRVQKSLEELDSLVFKADPKVGDTKMVFGNQMKWTGSKWEKEGGAGEEEAPEEEMGVEDQAFVDETISNLESMGFDKEDYNTLLNAGFTPEDIADMDENEVDEAVQEMDKAEAGRAEEAQDMMDIGIELVESGEITQEELMEMDPSELEDRIREKMEGGELEEEMTDEEADDYVYGLAEDMVESGKFTQEEVESMSEDEIIEAAQEGEVEETPEEEGMSDDEVFELVESMKRGELEDLLASDYGYTKKDFRNMGKEELRQNLRSELKDEKESAAADKPVDEDAATILELEGGRDEIEGTLEEGGYSPSDLKKMSTSELLTIASEEGFVREDVVNMVNDLSGYEPGTEEFDDALTVWGTDLGMSDEEISNIGSKFGHEW